MASFNFNKAIIAGRITDTPVLQTKEGRDPMTFFDVAISRKMAEHVTDYLKVVAWGKNAEFVCERFAKGSSVCVVGNIRTRSYTQDGIRRYSTEIVAEEVFEIDAKTDMENLMRRLGDENIIYNEQGITE